MIFASTSLTLIFCSSLGFFLLVRGFLKSLRGFRFSLPLSVVSNECAQQKPFLSLCLTSLSWLTELLNLLFAAVLACSIYYSCNRFSRCCSHVSDNGFWCVWARRCRGSAFLHRDCVGALFGGELGCCSPRNREGQAGRREPTGAHPGYSDHRNLPGDPALRGVGDGNRRHPVSC